MLASLFYLPSDSMHSVKNLKPEILHEKRLFKPSELAGHICVDTRSVETIIYRMRNRPYSKSDVDLYMNMNSDILRVQTISRNGDKNFTCVEDDYSSSVYRIENHYSFKDEKGKAQKTKMVFHALAGGIAERAYAYDTKGAVNDKRTAELQREMDLLRTMDNFKEAVKWCFGRRRPSVQQSHDRVRKMSERYMPILR